MARKEAPELLSGDLGEHHDLAVLRAAAPGLAGASRESGQLLDALASARQETLEAAALDRGRKLLAEKPSEVAERWQSWWQSARKAAGT